MQSSTGRTRAFTLLELLVVIAIIGILAALLMPVYSKAKNKASQTIDINNLKQFITTVHLYATDNNDYLPWPNWLAGDRPDRPGWLYTIDPTASGADQFKVETGVFWAMLRSLKLYSCPMDDPLERDPQQQHISSYVMNGAVVGYGRMDYPPVRGASLRGGDVVFWETDETRLTPFNDGSSAPDEGVSRRHNQGAIRAAFGGAIGYIRFDEWDRLAAATNRNELWCYPRSVTGR